jgi:hypothetical protein
MNKNLALPLKAFFGWSTDASNTQRRYLIAAKINRRFRIQKFEVVGPIELFPPCFEVRVAWCLKVEQASSTHIKVYLEGLVEVNHPCSKMPQTFVNRVTIPLPEHVFISFLKKGVLDLHDDRVGPISSMA